MRSGMIRLSFVVLALAGIARQSRADFTIIDSTNSYQLGIGTLGNLYDPTSGIGLKRVSDGLDVIIPGTPRDAYGISAGAVNGNADPSFGGVLNITSGSATSTANTANITTFLNNGTNLLRVDQSFIFVAANVAQILTTVTNVSGASQAVKFRRAVDFDTAPTTFNQTSQVDALTGPITAASFDGFESADPAAAFGSPAPAAGGSATGDLGGAFDIDLGTLGNGASTSFNIFYGLNTPGQSVGALRSQVSGLGATFLISDVSTDEAGSNSAVVAFGPTGTTVATPLPPTLVAGFLGMGLLAGVRRFRRA